MCAWYWAVEGVESDDLLSNLSHSMVLWRGRGRTTKMLSKKSEMRNLGKKVTSSRSSVKES